MTNKITGCAAGHDDSANVRVAGEPVERLGQRVAHLLVEIDTAGAAQCKDRNSIGNFCRQNIGVHRVLVRGSVAGRPTARHWATADNKKMPLETFLPDALTRPGLAAMSDGKRNGARGEADLVERG